MLRENRQVLVEPWHPTPEQKKIMEATDATSEWMNHMPSEVLRQYRDQWIAAKDCRVIASGHTMEELMTNLGDTDTQIVVIMCLRQPIQVIYK